MAVHQQCVNFHREQSGLKVTDCENQTLTDVLTATESPVVCDPSVATDASSAKPTASKQPVLITGQLHSFHHTGPVLRKGRLELKDTFLYDIKLSDKLLKNWPALASVRLIVEERWVVSDKITAIETSPDGESIFHYIECGDRNSFETHYYMTNFPDKDKHAKFFAERITRHWGIENELHRVKDVVFKEDHSTIRNRQAAKNLSLLLSIVISAMAPLRDCCWESFLHAYANKIDDLYDILINHFPRI